MRYCTHAYSSTHSSTHPSMHTANTLPYLRYIFHNGMWLKITYICNILKMCGSYFVTGIVIGAGLRRRRHMPLFSVPLGYAQHVWLVGHTDVVSDNCRYIISHVNRRKTTACHHLIDDAHFINRVVSIIIQRDTVAELYVLETLTVSILVARLRIISILLILDGRKSRLSGRGTYKTNKHKYC